eukprot:1861177-Rhodomonas_salina.1
MSVDAHIQPLSTSTAVQTHTHTRSFPLTSLTSFPARTSSIARSAPARSRTPRTDRGSGWHPRSGAESHGAGCFPFFVRVLLCACVAAGGGREREEGEGKRGTGGERGREILRIR